MAANGAAVTGRPGKGKQAVEGITMGDAFAYGFVWKGQDVNTKDVPVGPKKKYKLTSEVILDVEGAPLLQATGSITTTYPTGADGPGVRTFNREDFQHPLPTFDSPHKLLMFFKGHVMRLKNADGGKGNQSNYASTKYIEFCQTNGEKPMLWGDVKEATKAKKLSGGSGGDFAQPTAVLPLAVPVKVKKPPRSRAKGKKKATPEPATAESNGPAEPATEEGGPKAPKKRKSRRRRSTQTPACPLHNQKDCQVCGGAADQAPIFTAPHHHLGAFFDANSVLWEDEIFTMLPGGGFTVLPGDVDITSDIMRPGDDAADQDPTAFVPFSAPTPTTPEQGWTPRSNAFGHSMQLAGASIDALNGRAPRIPVSGPKPHLDYMIDAGGMGKLPDGSAVMGSTFNFGNHPAAVIGFTHALNPLGIAHVRHKEEEEQAKAEAALDIFLQTSAHVPIA